jgi:SAM-dependent methyltransferase
MPRHWSAEDVLALARAYQPTCVLAAATELDVFAHLAAGPRTATELAARLGADVRGTTVLLDALVALELLGKQDDRYAAPPDVAELLGGDGPGSALPMVLHQANCLRRWAQLARVVRDRGHDIPTGSVRGPAGDQESFIGAMHTVSRSTAPQLVARLVPPPFQHLLDIGGASGTWAIEFLRQVPGATATLFDLPDVIPMARRRLADEGLLDRFRLVAGNFDTDELPSGADLAWVSAIAHQNSRAENRALFARVRRALVPGGRVLVRDIVMDEGRTRPTSGALFAVNMLVGTAAGSTYTLAEYRADLEAAGFTNVTLLHRDEGMNSVIQALGS